MAHIFAPNKGLILSENKHLTKHLDLVNKKGSSSVILNVEEFYGDFRKACMIVVEKIKKSDYRKESKVYRPFLVVPKK
jgi:flavorubredoxin